jgi:hypothetical protein
MKYLEIQYIEERYVQIMGRKDGKNVRKYRCTSGTRKGRIVASPTTCTAPRNVKKSTTMKATKRKRGSVMSFKTGRRRATGAASQRLSRLNVHYGSKLKPKKRTTAKRKKI